MTIRILTFALLLTLIACDPQDFIQMNAETEDSHEGLFLQELSIGSWQWGDDPNCEMAVNAEGPRPFVLEVYPETIREEAPNQTTWDGDIVFERPHTDPSICLGYLDVQHYYVATAEGNRVHYDVADEVPEGEFPTWDSPLPNVVTFDMLFRLGENGEATGEICGKVATNCGGGRRHASFRVLPGDG